MAASPREDIPSASVSVSVSMSNAGSPPFARSGWSPRFSLSPVGELLRPASDFSIPSLAIAPPCELRDFLLTLPPLLEEAPCSRKSILPAQEKARFELAFMMDYYVPWLLEEDLVTLEDPLRACLVQLRQLWGNGARDRQHLRSAMQEMSYDLVQALNSEDNSITRTHTQQLRGTLAQHQHSISVSLGVGVLCLFLALSTVAILGANGVHVPRGVLYGIVAADAALCGLHLAMHSSHVVANTISRSTIVSEVHTGLHFNMFGTMTTDSSRRSTNPLQRLRGRRADGLSPEGLNSILSHFPYGAVIQASSGLGPVIYGMEHWGDAVGFMAVSPDGMLVLWSSGAEAHFLVPRASLVGRPVQDVVTITLDRGDRAALEFAFPGAKRVTVQATFFSGFFVSNESLQTTVYAWETGATRRDVVGLSALRCAELKGKVDVLLSEARKAGSSCRGAVVAAESVAAAIGNLSYDALREAAKASAAFAPVSAAYLNESLMSIRGVITVSMSTEVLTAYIDLVTLKSVLSEVVGKAPGHVSVSRVELVPAGGSGDPAVDVLDFTVSHEGDASVALSEPAQRAVTFMAGTFESSAGQSRLQVAMFPTHAQRGFKRELVNGGQFAESAQLAVQPPLTFVLLENDSVVRATLVMRIWRCRSTVIVCYKPDEAMQLIYNHATHIHVVVVDMDGFSLPELDRIVDAMASHSSIMWVAASRCNRFPDSVPAQCRYSKPLSTEVVMTIAQRAWLALLASQSTPSPSLQPAGGHSELNVMPYDVGLRLGKGATCDVFEASLPAICGTAALKRVYIGGEEGEARLQEARSEVAIIASLSHPNIVRYFFSSEDRQHLNIFVELCRDGSLGSKLRQTGAFGCVDAHECVMALLDVLAYMHSQNIVHRDLKPDNLLFRDGVLKLADFGSATKLGDSPLTDLSGTILYMAPEVLLQEPYRERCDIWSFGCVVADVLGVTLPHQRDPSLPSLVAAYRAMSSSDGAIVPDFLPADIADFLRSCLRRDPLKRPSALQLMQHQLMREAKLRGSLGAFLQARRGSVSLPLSLDDVANDAARKTPRRVLSPEGTREHS